MTQGLKTGMIESIRSQKNYLDGLFMQKKILHNSKYWGIHTTMAFNLKEIGCLHVSYMIMYITIIQSGCLQEREIF